MGSGWGHIRLDPLPDMAVVDLEVIKMRNDLTFRIHRASREIPRKSGRTILNTTLKDVTNENLLKFRCIFGVYFEDASELRVTHPFTVYIRISSCTGGVLSGFN